MNRRDFLTGAATGALVAVIPWRVRAADAIRGLIPSKISVVDWISYDEADLLPNSLDAWGGWFDAGEKGHTWSDYLAQWRRRARRYVVALRREIVAKGIRGGGHFHQEDRGQPLFSDGTVCSMTMRGWGDLQAAIWTEEDGIPYNYCHFAWEGPEGPDGEGIKISAHEAIVEYARANSLSPEEMTEAQNRAALVNESIRRQVEFLKMLAKGRPGS